MPPPDDKTPIPEPIIAPKFEERSEKNMATLFGEDVDDTPRPEDEVKPDPAPKAKPKAAKPAPEPEPEPEDEEEEEQEDEVDDESDEDYDAPAAKPKKAEAEPDPEADPKDETMARKMAKENGRKFKAEKTRREELELERDRLQEELTAERARREEIEQTDIEPLNAPEIKKLREKVLNDVKRGAAMLGVRDPKPFRDNFGKYLDAYMASDSLEGEEFDTAMSSLRSTIISEVGGFDEAYDDLTELEQTKADAIAMRAIEVIERAVPHTREALTLAQSLKAKAKTGQLARGTQDYEKAVTDLKPVLDAIGDIPDEAIEADPHNVASVVARMAKESPEAKRRIEKAKADVLEILVGPRALTQAEADKLLANGTDLKTFYAEREKAVQEKRKRLLPQLVQGLATRAMFKEVLAKLAKFEGEAGEEDEEFDAIRRTRKKVKTVVEKKDPVPPRQRVNSVLSKTFGENFLEDS